MNSGNISVGRHIANTCRTLTLTALAILAMAGTATATADTFGYSGIVTAGEGALLTLVPVDAPLIGPIGITTTPGGSTTDPADIVDALLSMQNPDTGGLLFCFFYNQECPPTPPGSPVPITAITAVNLTFDADGCPVSGSIELFAFSPTFMLDIPVTLDITSGTFVANAGALGSVEGTGMLDCNDADDDGVSDNVDNCTLLANPGQQDADGDLIGNRCDADITNDCVVNFGDISLFPAQFLGTNPVFDFDSSGAVNFADYAIMTSFFLAPPGPSAAGCN